MKVTISNLPRWARRVLIVLTLPFMLVAQIALTAIFAGAIFWIEFKLALRALVQSARSVW